jgi:capsular polysaccharide biosynthesis protein/cellulose biosynthesis protein BcsQ
VTMRDHLDLVRFRWRAVLAGLLLGLLVAGLFTVLVPRQYASDVVLFLSPSSVAADPGGAVDAGELAAQRMTTYTEVLTSDTIANQVAARLGAEVAPNEIAGKITASFTPDTFLITATVVDRSPEQAARIANLVGEEFIRAVAELETPPGSDREGVLVARVFEAAEPATAPASSSPPFNLLLGALLGLLAGFLLAVFRDKLDSTIRSPGQLEQIVGAPVIGEITADPGLAEHPLVITNRPQSHSAHEFRRVSTTMQFGDPAHENRLILLAGTAPGVGSTTTLRNVATAMANSGEKVLVIETDSRESSMADRLGPGPAVGPATVPLADTGLHAIRTVQRGLDVLPAQSLYALLRTSLDARQANSVTPEAVPPDPGELLSSTAMAEFVAAVRERYDHVLVDAAPLLDAADAAAVAGLADGVVLVVRIGRTSRDQVRAALGVIDGVAARVLGVVVTGAPATPRDRRYVRSARRPAQAGSRGPGGTARPRSSAPPRAAPVAARPAEENGSVSAYRPAGEPSRRPSPVPRASGTGRSPESGRIDGR